MGKMFQKLTIDKLADIQLEELKQMALDRYIYECKKLSVTPQILDPMLTEVTPRYIRFFNEKAEELATVYCEIDKYTDKRVFRFNLVWPETA